MNVVIKYEFVLLKGQYHLGLGGAYEGSEPTAPNTATPADCWDTTSMQDHHTLTPFPNSVSDSPTTPTSVSQYYLQQVIMMMIMIDNSLVHDI
jgi:hypothetical protein